MSDKSKYQELRSINVNDKIERKNGLSYLSWSWALDQLLLADPTASWEFHEPTNCGSTVIVWVSVTCFGKTNKWMLPVMDHRNKAIANPDAFAVNTAYMRCLTKCISTHGLGLYIYAGEDLPEQEKKSKEEVDDESMGLVVDMEGCESIDVLKLVWVKVTDFLKMYPEYKEELVLIRDNCKKRLTKEN